MYCICLDLFNVKKILIFNFEIILMYLDGGIYMYVYCIVLGVYILYVFDCIEESFEC